jgi:hypothetical protein
MDLPPPRMQEARRLSQGYVFLPTNLQDTGKHEFPRYFIPVCSYFMFILKYAKRSTKIVGNVLFSHKVTNLIEECLRCLLRSDVK